jgi:hypothetical protein
MPIIEEKPQGLGLKHDNIEEAFRIPIFESSTLSSLCATLFIWNCCRTHGASNAFITELLGLFSKSIPHAPNTLSFSEYISFIVTC